MTKRLSVLCASGFLGATFFVLSAPARAALVTCGNAGQNPCTFTDLLNLANVVIRFALFNIALPLVTALVVFLGIKLIISRGKPGEFAQARKQLTNTLIGLAIAFGAWIIVDTLLRFIAMLK